MANITPNSKLSAYKCFQQQISANEEEEEGHTSCQARINIENKGRTKLHNGPILIQTLFEESPSQGSSQKGKRRNSEEDKLH
ncbi:hypothetical protein O181_082997 [Austropuccinia psidii MF-1]|uniref:Uncharacterized protein n=1 Tax=Austropuccinia psidii MF-1 TaxID=1389203 RepID=A0A9Q3IJQ4_9BASI|nr:hypothetical protein [Austropuccinia psidii MF-1]